MVCEETPLNNGHPSLSLFLFHALPPPRRLSPTRCIPENS